MSSGPSSASNRPLQIGKYRLLARIATGGMGSVYKAQDLEVGRVVALKILNPDLAANPRLLERFQREGQHNQKLNHENVVTLYECGEANGLRYLAMEFVDGIDLFNYVQAQGQVDVEESRQIIIQAAKGIAHLNRNGIIHRDIKPSNFLLMKKDGRPFVKLIDLGLARQANDDQESRVTRAGSTLGTVDYISPEQASNSGQADIRSDLYSLGCTWYHLLAGQPPFAEGTVGERVIKQMKMEVPDIRTLNPAVPLWVMNVLRRMLAKDPVDRYQTPVALLRDLEAGGGKQADKTEECIPTDLLEGLAQEHDAADWEDDDDSDESPRLRDEDDEDEDDDRRPRGKKKRGKRRPSHTKLWILGVGLAVLVVLGALGFWLRSQLSSPPSPGDPPGSGSDLSPAADTRPVLLDTRPLSPPSTRPNTSTRKNPDPVTPLPSPPSEEKDKSAQGKPDLLRRLYQPVLPIDEAKLRQDFEGPWKVSPAPLEGPVFRVERIRRENDAQSFDSLAAACAAAPANRETIVEIHDNGPFFEAPMAVSGRSLVLRAGKDFRPLIAWDVRHQASAKAAQFLALSAGNLRLENLDVVLKCAKQGQTDYSVLFAVTDGSLSARGCTFSVAGNHSAGVAVVRLDESHPGAGCKCRLSQCVVRGSEVVALDVRALGAEALLEGCLVVGGERPLVDVLGSNPLKHSTIRVWRSTLVAGQNLLRLRSTSPKSPPGLRWQSWDALLTHSGSEAEGVMVLLGEHTSLTEVQWQAVNCLYAGWKNLLTASSRTIATIEDWHAQWTRTDGDVALGPSWPAVGRAQPAEILPEEYRTTGTPVRFAATSGPGELGCDLDVLPPARSAWVGLTFETILPSGPDLPRHGLAPQIQLAAEGPYHGERLDLSKVEDLGAYLQDLRLKRGLGPKVVLHLVGVGDHPTSPIQLQGVSLVLYVEPVEDEKATPLTLVPRPSSAADREALIAVQDGSLEMDGVTIRFLDQPVAALPAHMLSVRGGDLRLCGCRLEGPLAQPPVAYKSLIYFEGTNGGADQSAPGCAVADSLLISGKAAIQMAGHRARLRLNNCALVSGGDALNFEPSALDRGRLDIQCTLERNTVAIGRALIHLADTARVSGPVDPILVQAKANVILDPFASSASQAGLLLYEGAALRRGLLVWHGQGNVYDKRFAYYVRAASELVPDKPQPYTTWSHLWGTGGDLNPVLDLMLSHNFHLDRPPKGQMGQLALPSLFKAKPLPGADLIQLGLVKKKTKKPK